MEFDNSDILAIDLAHTELEIWYSKNLKNVKTKFCDKLIERIKSNINSEVNSNNKKQIKPKSKNKSLYRSGNLYNSIKKNGTNITMKKYGYILDKGSKNTKARSFIVRENTKQYKQILEEIKKELIN